MASQLMSMYIEWAKLRAPDCDPHQLIDKAVVMFFIGASCAFELSTELTIEHKELIEMLRELQRVQTPLHRE